MCTKRRESGAQTAQSDTSLHQRKLAAAKRRRKTLDERCKTIGTDWRLWKILSRFAANSVFQNKRGRDTGYSYLVLWEFPGLLCVLAAAALRVLVLLTPAKPD